jgi:hypothetical protein
MFDPILVLNVRFFRTEGVQVIASSGSTKFIKDRAQKLYIMNATLKVTLD